jgi:hypothetical protein
MNLSKPAIASDVTAEGSPCRVSSSWHERLDRKIWISLLLFLSLSLVSCASSQDSEQELKQWIIGYLSATFGQPQDNWEEGKIYFLPDRHGIEPLGQPGEQIEGVRVFRASIWTMHWGPERFPVLVWVVTKEGEVQMGLLDSPADIATELPEALHRLVFEEAAIRRRLAVLVGEMVNEFYSPVPKGRLVVFSEAECEWAANAAVGRRGRIAASCFSSAGALERIILASTRSAEGRGGRVGESARPAPSGEPGWHLVGFAEAATASSLPPTEPKAAGTSASATWAPRAWAPTAPAWPWRVSQWGLTEGSSVQSSARSDEHGNRKICQP